MTNQSRSIKNLQQALSMELTATHQYLLHAHVLEDWGLETLAAKMHEEMQEELGHAGNFIDRILFLDGDPKVSEQKPAHRADTLKDLFEADLKDEKEAIAFYTEAANAAREDDDVGTRAMFERIVMDEEGHMDWLKQQLDLIRRIGEQSYIAQHMTLKPSE
jgi:bacterioferritin